MEFNVANVVLYKKSLSYGLKFGLTMYIEEHIISFLSPLIHCFVSNVCILRRLSLIFQDKLLFVMDTESIYIFELMNHNAKPTFMM